MFSGVRARLCVGAATALAFLLVLTSAASAAPTWLGALDLSSVSDFSSQPAVATDAAGEAVALWTDTSGTLLASVHPPDGAWQSPQTIATGASFGDQVAFDARGDATALWVSASTVVESATLAAGASAWSTAAPVSPANAGSPDLTVGAQGEAVAVWTSSVVQAAFRPTATSAWQPPVPLSATGDAVASPQVALDPQGDAVADWLQSSKVVEATSRPALSGIWQTPVAVSASAATAAGPQVAFDSAGRATAMWSDSSGIHSSDQPLGGGWSSPATIPGSGGGVDPSLAVDPQGDAAATWDQPAGASVDTAEGATRPAGDVWQTAVALSAVQSSNHTPDPRVELDGRGDAVAVWNAFDGTNNTVVAASRPVGGSWPAPAAAETLSGDATIPTGQQLAVDPQGNATVVWALFDGATSLVQAAGYDASGPLLNALSIPATGTVGVPVTFSVAPLDAWSAVASTSWSFGDGQKGSGQTLTHDYATPGTYTVTVTSADALGNATSQSRKISVAAAPKPPPTSKAPVLSGVSEKHKKWRETAKSGTSFSFTVDQPATVTLAFKRRSKAEGSLKDAVGKGRHTIKFRGRIGKRKLPLGAYTVALTATNSTKQRSRTATLKFTVVK